MGMGMAQTITSGPWGMAQHTAAQTPPPPPVEHVWHIADKGQTTGPYSKARLGRMVTEGTFSRNTLVWTAGQDGWKTAQDVDELAQLFTVIPPPPPQA